MIFQTVQWQKLVRGGLLFGLALSGLGRAQAGVLWDNGAINNTSPRHCDSSPLQCGGNTNIDNGFEVYDNFTLSASATVGGFTYNDTFRNGPTSDYTSTNWTLWSGDPMTETGPTASGNISASLSAGGLASTLFTVTGLSINLSVGTYWLGIQNVLSNPANSTDRFYADGNGLSGFEQSTTGINSQFGTIRPFAVTGDTAFTVEDNAAPEPASGLLFIVPLALLGLRRFQR